MPKYKSLIKISQETLDIKKQLHPLLFDENGIMFEEMRQKFIGLADFLVRKTCKTLNQYKVADIVLVGSAASYFYNEDSDFDVKIMLDLTANPAIGLNIKKFIQIINNTYFRSKVKFVIDNHFVDMKFGIDENYVMGNYSIQQRKWNIAPRNDFSMDNISSAVLIKMFYEAEAYLNEKLSQLHFSDTAFANENIAELRNIYNHFLTADERVRANVESGLADFLAFKIFRKFLYLQDIVTMENLLINQKLSLREETRP